MAEILLSLTIIGVVAAITLPSLTGNINERTWNTQRKALYARMSQAIALMPALNGYGTFTAATDSASAVDTAAETFVTEGLSKVLKINNICDSDHLADCGIAEKVTPMNGGSILELTGMKLLSEFNPAFSIQNDSNANFSYSQFDTKAVAFETVNGESILAYYNPNCKPKTIMNAGVWNYTQPMMCANFVYDLNGNKGPNTVGKDIGFITALYPSDSVVIAPMPLPVNAGSETAVDGARLCVQQDAESRLPNIEELSAMLYNQHLLGITSDNYWSGTLDYISETMGKVYMAVNFGACKEGPWASSYKYNIRCVKR